jgi:hypothetical protein
MAAAATTAAHEHSYRRTPSDAFDPNATDSDGGSGSSPITIAVPGHRPRRNNKNR